jgi:hypothetical protein
MIADVAFSVGDVLQFESQTPGGSYLVDRINDPTFQGLVSNGNWNHVVLQDQSLAYTTTAYFSAAYQLDSIIKGNNPCAQTMFYITWGRADAMAGFYPSYYAMDCIIESNYMQAANNLNAEVTPVGAIWRHLRLNYPSIELFASDGSHPSVAGTYAAACGFYASLFRKDPSLATFNSTITPADAAIIRAAAKLVVYDNLNQWNIGVYDSLLNGGCTETGVEMIDGAMHFSVYPNPTNAIITIEKSPLETTSAYTIVNQWGEVVLRKTSHTTVTTLDLSNLPAGLYFLATDNRVLKIIKQD